MNVVKQEYQVKVLLPEVRKHMSKRLVDKGFTQKKIAKILCLTEGAISQYINDKRVNYSHLNLKQQSIIDTYCAKIIKSMNAFEAQSKCLDHVFKWDKINIPNETAKS